MDHGCLNESWFVWVIVTFKQSCFDHLLVDSALELDAASWSMVHLHVYIQCTSMYS